MLHVVELVLFAIFLWYILDEILSFSYNLVVVIGKIKHKTTCSKLWHYCTFVPPFFIDDSGAEFHAD